MAQTLDYTLPDQIAMVLKHRGFVEGMKEKLNVKKYKKIRDHHALISCESNYTSPNF